MSEPAKKLPLQQIGDSDHAKKIMNEKIGSIADLIGLGGGPAIPMETVGVKTADQKALVDKIVAQLCSIFDPEIPLNIYDLGLIYKLIMHPTNAVKIEMTLTAPACPVAGEIVAEVKKRVESIPEIPQAEIELVWEPQWDRTRLSEAARLTLGIM